MRVRCPDSLVSGSIFVLVGLLFAALAVPASGQMLLPGMNVSVRNWTPSNTCGNAPAACAAGNRDLNLGPHEFHIYNVPMVDGTFSSVRMYATWPESWAVLGWEVCYAQHLSGDPTSNGDLLEFAFPGCAAELHPFLRIWLDCTTPGRFLVTPVEAPGCAGSPWPGVHQHADIGDFCGAYSYAGCNACTEFDLLGYAGTFEPEAYSASVAPNEVLIDTLVVSGSGGTWCYGLPECGGDGPGGGFSGIQSTVPWMDVTLLDYPQPGWHQMRYRVVINSGSLGPGTHEGRVLAPAGCQTAENCMPVTLLVDPALTSAPGGADVSGVSLLGLPHPNPSNGTVHFALHQTAEARVQVIVVDAGGRVVAQLLNGVLPAGTTQHTWSPSNEFRRTLAAGVFFLRAESSAGSEARMFVLRR